MKLIHFAAAIFVASLIFFGATLYGYHTSTKTSPPLQIYLEPKKPAKIFIINYAGEIKINITITGKTEQSSSIKNITVSLDGNKIPMDTWISTRYIGIHTLVINSTARIIISVLIICRGRSPLIPLSFGIITALSASGMAIEIMRGRKNKKG